MTKALHPTARSRRTFSARQVFPVVATVMFLLAGALWVPVLRLSANLVDPEYLLLGMLVLLVAFLAGELFPLHIEVRRETLLVSGSELPMVLGLLLLPAWTVGLTHLVASGLVFLFRRDSSRNIAVNLSFIAAETGAAALIMLLITRAAPAPPVGVQYLAVSVGVLTGALLSAIAVGLTYRLLGPAEPLGRIIVRSMISALAIVTFALVGYTVWMAGPFGPWLCVALAGVLAVLYRTYFVFLRQHADLTRMYSFVREVGAVGAAADGWRGVLEQVRDQFNAEVAVLRLDEGDGSLAGIAVGPDGPRPERTLPDTDPLLVQARSEGRVRVSTDRTMDTPVLAALAERQAWDVLVVPLRSGDRDRGYLELHDRLSRWDRFRDEDLRVLETLGGHVATALDNLRLMDSLRHEAYHDAITGLRNRVGLTVAGQEAMSGGGGGAILLVELNVLSQVNNALGHDRGELLLRMAGERLVALVGPTRPVARIEADRFAVLCEPLPETELTALGGQMLSAVGGGYSIDGIEIDPQGAVGIAVVPAGAAGHGSDSGLEPSVLLQRAEMAMLAAKVRQESVQIYRPSMGEVYRRRFQLVTQFRQAVEQGRIIVHYQPKVDLAHRELVGVEALVRWMHPEFGLVSPAEFVEAIEATGSIDILLEHVLDSVLAQLWQWRSAGLHITASVNLSVHNLLAENFPATVAAALRRHQVPAQLLTFEITESNVMTDPEHSLPVLRELHAMGIQLSVDDFGTGYSSLAYLRRLPIDEIKIDRSFVQGMGTDLSDLAIVRAIVDLGHSLGLRVVAEGVEEEAARDALREMACDEAQGFLISRPVPLDRFEAWLASRTVSIYDPASTTHVLRMMS
ncbi:putative bifunctional diguanylate cyclase/phosphodiesterase [Nakamurella multipartita]|uniref:Diguanylate cyclase/phosphodiesterase with GAF sensor n=1 Tax=Nakamurella multipartita (strain ATCC 700099 / DSM 44233 / CIP 104796 / JCM 9543 / NBRC 105858 / Y-104) TaxID=479431 RepID=C8XBF4_NAKMY|nr:EAL domain-containing protein [Nakamurella multipartita]ACV77416.1 diguanylate cyclase/phosphodiesterase with GAF sensor [Nakamurella multipartita DSM 44233]